MHKPRIFDELILIHLAYVHIHEGYQYGKDFLKVLSGKLCPYCLRKTVFTNSSVIYGRSYGMVYFCSPCNAYVGVHKGTKTALGRVATSELREKKKSAHKVFDKLWREGEMSRSEAYLWLADRMNIQPKYCHIGMMNIEECEQVIGYCEKK